ncbi:unnamed protein product [Linum tenue]|uniref:Uncharacterized protein n=1 Tax=Linum tenue TaxID=586396 RepID=A0AAV0PSH7_9ROSI|nr:unnamed protein product [Linum tenue]
MILIEFDTKVEMILVKMLTEESDTNKLIYAWFFHVTLLSLVFVHSSWKEKVA